MRCGGPLAKTPSPFANKAFTPLPTRNRNANGVTHDRPKDRPTRQRPGGGREPVAAAKKERTNGTATPTTDLKYCPLSSAPAPEVPDEPGRSREDRARRGKGSANIYDNYNGRPPLRRGSTATLRAGRIFQSSNVYILSCCAAMGGGERATRKISLVATHKS